MLWIIKAVVICHSDKQQFRADITIHIKEYVIEIFKML